MRLAHPQPRLSPTRVLLLLLLLPTLKMSTLTRVAAAGEDMSPCATGLRSQAPTSMKAVHRKNTTQVTPATAM